MMEFDYSVEQREAIKRALPKGVDELTAEYILVGLRGFARQYLRMLDLSSHLPDKGRLREKREQTLSMLETVRAMIHRDRRLGDLVDNNGFDTNALCRLFLADRTTDIALQNEFALEALDRLILEYRRLSDDEVIKQNGKEKTWRNEFIDTAVMYWVDLGGKCTVSSGGPVVRYVLAVVKPVADLANEKLDEDMIRTIVRPIMDSHKNRVMKAAE
jgi:hypothetical protein